MENKSFITTEVSSPINISNRVDKEALVQTLNDEMARLMLPATIYIIVLMVFGLVGNSMVCYYYGFKAKRTTNSYFIVVLALYDITVCAFCMPTEIADIELFYTFENNVACKILRFLNYLAGIGSILTLLAIATDRFKKICRATAPQMTMRITKLTSIVVFGSALLLSWPSLAIYGSIKVNIPNDFGIDLKGSDCTSTKDKQYRKYVWAFNIVHFLMFIICSIVLIVLYSIIGHTIYHHQKIMRRYKCKRKISHSLNKETSLTTTSSNVESKTNVDNVSLDEADGNSSDARVKKPATIKNSKTKLRKPETSASDREPSGIDSETIKLTIVMIIVTVVFIVSFLPYLSLTVWRVYKGKHEAEFLSGGGLVGFKIGSRSFLLNSTLNPWIYGIFNTNFRQFFFGWIRNKNLRNCCT